MIYFWYSNTVPIKALYTIIGFPFLVKMNKALLSTSHSCSFIRQVILVIKRQGKSSSDEECGQPIPHNGTFFVGLPARLLLSLAWLICYVDEMANI